MQSFKTLTWPPGLAGSELSEEPEDDEHGNSERPGAEFNTSHTERLLAGRS